MASLMAVFSTFAEPKANLTKASSMKVQFSKYQGSGNDFIIIDKRGIIPELPAKQINRLCDRNYGIGADGLIFTGISQGGNVLMHYFNSDGYEAGMCGNGGRCVAAWAAMQGLFKKEMTIEAGDGLHRALIEDSGIGSYNVKLEMNDVRVFKKFSDGFFINTGVPHFVMFCPDLNQVDVTGKGRLLRNDPRFQPEGANVNFVSIRDHDVVVRTYERGVEGETLSCGTGVTASALATMLKTGSHEKSQTMQTKGGTLTVAAVFNGDFFENIILEGPAQFVFKGEINL
jgi:diaminopimelate epimerase